MSYLVLARKYRPRDFDSLVGQPHVVQALSNALTQQRLHHAYLFTGTRGVGKTTIARILAKSLNCTGADGNGAITAHPCGACTACLEIDSGRYIDYVELDAASNRGVDEISQLLDQSVYKPVLGRFKVYMIDEVHMLTNHAFNAMLKSLEEPPGYLKFVLATTDPQKVPPTVLSRCLQFNLRPLAPQTMHAHLESVLKQEGIGAVPAALQLIARAARGSMRDALSLADQAIAHGGGAIKEAGVRQMLGAVDRGHAVRLVEALAARDGAAVIAAVDQLRALGLSAAGTLEEMAALLQQMAVRQAVPDAVELDAAEGAALLRLAALLASDETQLLYSIVLHGRAELELAPDEYSGLVMVLLRWLAFPAQGDGPVQPRPAATGERASRASAPDMAAMNTAAPSTVAAGAAAKTALGKGVPGKSAMAASAAPGTSTAPPAIAQASATVPKRHAVPEEPWSDPEPGPWVAPRNSTEPPAWVEAPDAAELENSNDTNPHGASRAEVRAPAAAPSRSAPEAPAALVTTELGDRWADVVGRMVGAGSIGALVRELAMQAQCVAIDAGAAPMVWRLRVERETLRVSSHCEKLQAALAQLLGRAVRVETEPGRATDTPALREGAERARRQAEAEATIQNDPLVRALMAQYKTARIVPGSVKSI